MKCAVHTEVDAAGFCRDCGKSLCDPCKREVQGALYCESCLAALLAKPAPLPPGSGNPTLAAILGVIPGLGAVYNGEYMKAILHVVVLGTLMTLADKGHAEPVFVLATIFFWIYMPFEAYRTAKAKLGGKPTTDILGGIGANQPIGAYVLIGLGVLWLMDNLIPNFDPWEYIGKLWPVVLIALGVLMLRKRTQSSSGEEKQNG